MKLFYLFLAVYFAYVVTGINFNHLDADQGSHAMTGVFVSRMIKDLARHPVLNPRALMEYAKAYYVHYPKFVFNGPVYSIINGLLFLVFQSKYALKLLVAVMSAGVVFVTYLLFKKLMNEKTGILAGIITACSTVFVNYSRMIMPVIPAAFFFVLGLYFFSAGKKKLAGLFLGISMLTKEFTLVFVGAFLIASWKKQLRDLRLLGVLALTIAPYIILLVSTGGINYLLQYPQKQEWYGLHDRDPQWYEIGGWLFFFLSIVRNYSVIGLLFLAAGIYHAWKGKGRALVYFVIIAWLGVTLVSDKAYQGIIYGAPVFSGLIAYGFLKLYERKKILSLFLLVFMIGLAIPLSMEKGGSLEDAARYIFDTCPNCTVLIASENGSVYSSSLMYEALVIDKNISLRFLRPTSLMQRDVADLVKSEDVNRIVVLVQDNSPQIRFIMNRYPLIRIIGPAFIYDTGIKERKGPPYCFTSVAMNTTVCSNCTNPVSALK